MKARKKGKKILTILIVIALILAVVWLFVLPSMRKSTKTSSQTQLLQFKNIGELATQECDVVQVEKLTKDALKEKYNIDLPFVGTEVIYSYTVKIKAGFDFSKIDYQVDEKQKSVTVTLPEAKILSSEVDTDSYKCYSDYQSIFNMLSQDDQNHALDNLKKDAEQTAQDNGLLDNAKSNAEKYLTTMIQQTLGSDYKITFS
jgi:hypothetical protein